MGTKAISDDSFQADVLDSDTPVLVDFWAEWCGPCKMIGPALEEIADDIGDKVDILKLNIDDSPNTPAQYGVRGIPTMVLFKNGQPVAQKVGAAPTLVSATSPFLNRIIVGMPRTPYLAGALG